MLVEYSIRVAYIIPSPSQITRIGADRGPRPFIPHRGNKRNTWKKNRRGTRKHAGIQECRVDRGCAIPISEIIHHSVRRTSSGAFTSRREPSSKCALDGTFFSLDFFFFLFHFLSSTLNRFRSSLASSFPDIASRRGFARCTLAIQKVNSRIRFLDY